MKTTTKALAVMAVALSSALPAVAASPWVVSNNTTKTECSACHTLYAPGFLPKRSWRAIMSDLTNHFGEDASLTDAARTEITNYLVSQAPQDIRGVPASQTPLRITQLPWYTRIHGPRFVAYAQSHPSVGTLSNCTGCHRGAEQGIFGDD
jgi:mono/diheme cytochrome c family protein